MRVSRVMGLSKTGNHYLLTDFECPPETRPKDFEQDRPRNSGYLFLVTEGENHFKVMVFTILGIEKKQLLVG